MQNLQKQCLKLKSQLKRLVVQQEAYQAQRHVPAPAQRDAGARAEIKAAEAVIEPTLSLSKPDGGVETFTAPPEYGASAEAADNLGAAQPSRDVQPEHESSRMSPNTPLAAQTPSLPFGEVSLPKQSDSHKLPTPITPDAVVRL